MMNHYTWKVLPIPMGQGTADVAVVMEQALNSLEDEGFEVYDVTNAPAVDALHQYFEQKGGFLVIGRKPRRFPVGTVREPPFAR
jgi:hypothetical protein